MTVGIVGQIAAGFQTFNDARGRPLAGGRVYHYLPNTSTPITTYKDPNFDTPNEWPVRLDAGGRARIYYNGTVRQVLKDANDVLVWDTTTITSFSASSSAAVTLNTVEDLRDNESPYPLFYLLGYHDPGDGGGGHFWLDSGDTTSVDNGGTIIVDANGRRYKRPEVGTQPTNARWFGLMGIGDDATVIGQTMIDLGFNVYFPKGLYLSSGQWVFNTDGQKLLGDSWASTIIQFSGNYNALKFQGPASTSASSPGEGMGARDIRLDLTNMSGGYGIELDGPDRFCANNVYFLSPYNGVFFTKCNYVSFDTIYGQAVRGTAFFKGTSVAATRSDVIKLNRMNIGSSGKTWDGIVIEGAVNTIHITEVGFVNAKKGLSITNPTGVFADRCLFCIIYDFEVDYPAEQGVYATYVEGLWATTLYVQGSDTAEGIYLGTDVSSVKITNGYIRGNKKEGMVSGANDSSIVGTQFVFNSFGQFTTYDAVRLLGGANRQQFSNCAFGGLEGVGTVARYGCSIENGARAIRFAACDFYGCALSDLLDNSGATTPGNIQTVGCNAPEVLGSERLIGWDVNVRAGVGAAASATILGGVITSVSVTNGGREYGNGTWRGGLPVVVAYDPTAAGSGAVLVPTIDAATGALTSIAVSVGGANYSSQTVIRIIPGARVPTLRVRWPSLTSSNGMIQAAGNSSILMANDNGLSFGALANANAANYLFATGTASGSGPILSATGTDTDIDLVLQPKGTATINVGNPRTAASAGAAGNFWIIKLNGVEYKIQLYAMA